VREIKVEQNKNINQKKSENVMEFEVAKWRKKMLQAEKQRQENPRCLHCGQPEQIIWVHGHGQCAHCKVNTAPCCDGGSCD
jgi:hypothetical protein